MSARVLIVEDDQEIRETLTDLLEDAGYRCASAVNGLEALAHLRNEAILPDIILLDLRMPVLDGMGFRAEQLGDARLATIPVVIISANAQVREASEQMQVTGYLRKPVDLEALMATLKQHLADNR